MDKSTMVMALALSAVAWIASFSSLVAVWRAMRRKKARELEAAKRETKISFECLLVEEEPFTYLQDEQSNSTLIEKQNSLEH